MKTLKLLIIILLYNTIIFAQETIDKIAAVVDNEIILLSELNLQVSYLAAQRNVNPKDPVIQKQVLNAMINEKLLYAQAELDSVTVSEDEIEQQLDGQINYFINQYGSRERFEQSYGMTIDKIRRELRDDVKKNVMSQKVKQKKFGTMTVSRREVEQFFEEYRDSLGIIPEKFNIAHIFINPQKGERVKKAAYDFAKKLLDSLNNGANFGELAKKYSDDPGSAAQGGDLGYVKRGVFYPEFEAAAFSLKPGELSNVVESPVGYHIIQLIERRGEGINTRHILIKVKSDDESDLQAIEFLSDLRDSITRKINTFGYYALKYSDDKETSRFSGELGSFEIGQLDESLKDVVFKMKEGDISYPKRLDLDKKTYGFHIVKLVKRISEHKPTLETDFDELKKLAEYSKKEKLYNLWLEELRKTIFWEIKI
ncbi:MAG TPA: peptidylprolyl isomerase [Melioribacteraceae bacterium]|nr:peptidylprolyl isomerase [Melioribacteraceae bacterium]